MKRVVSESVFRTTGDAVTKLPSFNGKMVATWKPSVHVMSIMRNVFQKTANTELPTTLRSEACRVP